jgi:hypothetical protein
VHTATDISSMLLSQAVFAIGIFCLTMIFVPHHDPVHAGIQLNLKLVCMYEINCFITLLKFKPVESDNIYIYLVIYIYVCIYIER